MKSHWLKIVYLKVGFFIIIKKVLQITVFIGMTFLETINSYILNNKNIILIFEIHKIQRLIKRK